MASAMPVIGFGLSALGTIGQASAESSAGQAAYEAYDYNAAMKLRQSKEMQEYSREEFAQLMARQRSLYAKAGVDITSGSPLLVYYDTARKAAREQQRIKREGADEAYLLRKQGLAARKSGSMASGFTLLTGLGKAGIDLYSQYKANN